MDSENPIPVQTRFCALLKDIDAVEVSRCVRMTGPGLDEYVEVWPEGEALAGNGRALKPCATAHQAPTPNSSRGCWRRRLEPDPRQCPHPSLSNLNRGLAALPKGNT